MEYGQIDVTQNQEEIKKINVDINNKSKEVQTIEANTRNIQSTIQGWESKKNGHDQHFRHLEVEMNKDYSQRHLYNTEYEDQRQEIRQCDAEINQLKPTLNESKRLEREKKKEIKLLNKQIKRLQKEIKTGVKSDSAAEKGVDNPIGSFLSHFNDLLGSEMLIGKYIVITGMLLMIIYILIN